VALPDGWVSMRSRRYGGTVVTFARRVDPPAPADHRPTTIAPE
jgi:hypothetical protein